MPGDLVSDLARFYDQEAPARAVRALDAERVARRDAFIETIGHERAGTVLEVGTGPGRDAAAFVAAGLHVVGIDLSAAHARLASEQGASTTVASTFALPFADAACDAGWTMSTLVHVPNAQFDIALREICRVVRGGGAVAIGLWGAADDAEGVSADDTIEPKRFFSFRTVARVRTMLRPYGTIEQCDTWARANGGTYQFVILRTVGRAPGFTST